MNQILSNQIINIKERAQNVQIRKMKYIFFISIFIIIFFIIFYSCLKYNSTKNARIANALRNKFEIQNLYSINNDYNAKRLNIDINVEDYQPFVIGLLKVKKIELVYPILSSVSDELLEISPCRFYGPMPNTIGNMCVAGHNFSNQTHFAKLHLLEEGDLIQIYDLNGNVINYSIYQKSEINADDTSCLSQNTNFQREVTLVTCNTIKGTRVIVKAKETTI